MIDYPHGLTSECSADGEYERQFAAMGTRRAQQHARTTHELLVARVGVGLVIAIMLGVVLFHSLRNAW
jgi:hypothetical protein